MHGYIHAFLFKKYTFFVEKKYNNGENLDKAIYLTNQVTFL